MLSCLTWTNRNVMRMNETVLGVVIMIILRGLKLKNQFIASMSLWE